MKRIFLLCVCLTALLIGQSAFSQNVGQLPAPTLVPPTLVPTPDTGIFDTIPTESGVARIARNGVVRVGMLYNEPPFGLLNIRGDVAGYDADLARSMAEAWGVDVQFVQVTRQTALELLRSGQVDLLIAAQVHRRELDAQVEFSQTYVISSQAMMVREGDPALTLADMASRRVGVVLGTPAQNALAAWQTRSAINLSVQTYLTLSQAVTALLTDQVDGLVDARTRLLRAVAQPELVTLLDEAIAQEPYAVAMLRQDINLRNLVNRTLQYLMRSGRIYEIHNANVPEVPWREETIPLWANLGDTAPRPDQFPADIAYPAQYVLPRVMTERVVRVAGALDSTSIDTPESLRRLDALNRALVETMAARWGVTVQYVPNSAANPLEFVANGQADIAVGVQPDWNWSDRVDFTQVYFMRGYRLMVEQNSEIVDFSGLRGGRWVGVEIGDPNVRQAAIDAATAANARIEVLQTNDAAYAMLVDNNADVGFGDTLWLLPQLEANAGLLRLTERWYTRTFISLAVPRNDIDFRLLVEYTLQDLSQDGTLALLLQPVIPPGETMRLEVWPGLSG
ncbi:MAG: transporter substrate-binding domain-containing protein [Chloroflexi bacterium]|nr:transporter substrate-binding domain-containing protein [Chloroflexota bacterium]